MKRNIFKISITLGIALILGIAARGFFSFPEHPPTPASLEALKSLPYVAWVSEERDIAKKGVTRYDPEKSFSGLNVYSPANLPKAFLLDMSGNVLHTWSAKINPGDIWYHVKLCKNGDLLVIVANNEMLIRLDWNSNVKWVKHMRFHHDVAIAEKGDIYALERVDEVIPRVDNKTRIRNDCLVVLGSNGEQKKKISLAEVLLNSGIDIHISAIPPKDRSLLKKAWFKLKEYKKHHKLNLAFFVNLIRKTEKFSRTNRSRDLLHTNTVELIRADIRYGSKMLFRKGAVLTCMREMDIIGVIDLEEKKMTWHWGPGFLDRPHHPTLLENGNILIFDNGFRRKHSRIIEINPSTNRIVWECRSDPSEEFFSTNRGSSQRLPNGNTLVIESNSGRAFEVTKDGEIVWEFFNPEIDENQKKAAIYRLIRIVDPENFTCLRTLELAPHLSLTAR